MDQPIPGITRLLRTFARTLLAAVPPALCVPLGTFAQSAPAAAPHIAEARKRGQGRIKFMGLSKVGAGDTATVR
jgi:hypothetical protein